MLSVSGGITYISVGLAYIYLSHITKNNNPLQ